MAEIKLRPVWDAIVDIYRAFAQVCEANGLRYYLGYGSVLGAVRHKGFIPWDDDMDVIMPRPDYDKFCEIADKALPQHFKLVTIYNTKEFVAAFAKIQDSRADVYAKVKEVSGHPLGQGLFLDIFPIDGVPTQKWRQITRKIWHFCFQMKYRYVMRVDFGTRKSKLARMLGFLFYPFLPKISSHQDYTMKKIERLKNPRFGSTDLCGLGVDFVNKYIDYIPFPTEWLGVAEWGTFEGMKVPLPHEYKKHLEHQYGDYMKLPPPEKQKLPSHFDEHHVLWKFGPTND